MSRVTHFNHGNGPELIVYVSKADGVYMLSEIWGDVDSKEAHVNGSMCAQILYLNHFNEFLGTLDSGGFRLYLLFETKPMVDVSRHRF